jgi:hypothetical protein
LKKTVSFNWPDLGNMSASEEPFVAGEISCMIAQSWGRCLFVNHIRIHSWSLGGCCITVRELDALTDKFKTLSGLT